MGIKQFHFVCTFIIWYLFWSYISVATNNFNSETANASQNGYQTFPFSVHIHNLMFVMPPSLIWGKLRTFNIISFLPKYRCNYTDHQRKLSWFQNNFSMGPTKRSEVRATFYSWIPLFWYQYWHYCLRFRTVILALKAVGFPHGLHMGV